MSRPKPPAPLEIHIQAPEVVGDLFLATLSDPTSGKVLLTAKGLGHDAALERLLLVKRMSRVAKRRYVIKSGRSPAVQGLLGLIDLAERTTDADTEQDATFLPVSMDDFLARIRGAITAIEQGAKAVAA